MPGAKSALLIWRRFQQHSCLERLGILEARRGVWTFVRACQDWILKREGIQSRERELRAFADRILSEAHERGFSLDEVIDHLNGRRKKGE